MATKLYVENIDIYNSWLSRKYLIKEKAHVQTIDNGIILPPKLISKNTPDKVYAGGVATKNFEYVSGMRRHTSIHGNFSCEKSYKVSKEDLKYENEEVIFGGVLIKHFGHAILEDLARLWYVVKNKKDKRRIAFVCYNDLCSYHYELFELLGIKKDRIIIVDKPTQFTKIIVPDESIHSWHGYKKEYNLIYDEIRKNIKPKKYDKVYFTRTQLNEVFDVNEEFFEKLYKSLGFKIVAPEKLPLKEQIAYAMGAKELATTLGTLSHFGLFMDYGSKLIIYNRTKINKLVPQYIINLARNLDVTYIDALIEILPVEHAGGCVCMYPTEYFKKYLEDNKIDYSKQIEKMDKNAVIVKYIQMWAENYSKVIRYNKIEKYDMYDVINSIKKSLNGTELIKEEMFPPTSGKHLKSYWVRKSKKQEEEIKQLKNQIIELENNIKTGKKKKKFKDSNFIKRLKKTFIGKILIKIKSKIRKH